MKQIILTLMLALFTLPVLNAQDLPSYVPTEGLVAYYPFNGNANDESGGENHGRVDGATLTSDRDGNENSSYSFDGINDYIEISNVSDGINDLSESISISAWFRVFDIGDEAQTIIARRDFVGNPNGERHHFELSIQGQIENIPDYSVSFSSYDNRNLDLYNIQPYTNSNSYTLNNWNNVSIVFNSNNGDFKFFVNGNLISTNNFIGKKLFPYEHWVNIGAIRRTSGNSIFNFFNGELDDIGIWNRALTEQEIQNIYNSSNGDILLNGTVSAESNQIKNVADPTDAQDAATKGFIEGLLSDYQSQIDDLQDQIAAMQASTGSGTVTDQDGNSYPYLTYGTQIWTVENAEMVTYRDGTPIPQVTDNTEWQNLTTGAWSYYNNDPTKPRLYNWYAVMGIHDTDPNTPNKEFAPEGWHVPTDAEWTTLENYLITNGYNYDGTTTGNKIGKAMASTTGWNTSTNTGAIGNDQSLNNDSEFNAIPEGYRNDNGSFNGEGYYAIFWSSTESLSDLAWGRNLYSSYSFLFRGSDVSKRGGFSVRFVRD